MEPPKKILPKETKLLFGVVLICIIFIGMFLNSRLICWPQVPNAVLLPQDLLDQGPRATAAWVGLSLLHVSCSWIYNNPPQMLVATLSP